MLPVLSYLTCFPLFFSLFYLCGRAAATTAWPNWQKPKLLSPLCSWLFFFFLQECFTYFLRSHIPLMSTAGFLKPEVEGFAFIQQTYFLTQGIRCCFTHVELHGLSLPVPAVATLSLRPSQHKCQCCVESVALSHLRELQRAAHRRKLRMGLWSQL